MLPTQRLSPKNQVTLPRESRALLAAGELAHVRVLRHHVPAKDGGAERFPVLLMMSEAELTRREEAILRDQRLDDATRAVLIQQLNAGAALAAVDQQNRIVLAAHLIAHCTLERDVFFVSTNTLVYAWNPAHYLRWDAAPPAPATPDLNRYLLI